MESEPTVLKATWNLPVIMSLWPFLFMADSGTWSGLMQLQDSMCVFSDAFQLTTVVMCGYLYYHSFQANLSIISWPFRCFHPFLLFFSCANYWDHCACQPVCHQQPCYFLCGPLCWPSTKWLFKWFYCHKQISNNKISNERISRDVLCQVSSDFLI